MNVATVLVDQLGRWELGQVFGVSGANIELLFDAAARHDAVQPVLAKHEAAAAMMAIGYAERADRLGVVLTTSGGGAFNISAPLIPKRSSQASRSSRWLASRPWGGTAPARSRIHPDAQPGSTRSGSSHR
jgi:glyoxylate carboligase